MIESINVLLLSGGGHSEHEISLLSAEFFENILSDIPRIEIYSLFLDKHNRFIDKNGQRRELQSKGILQWDATDVFLHYAIPCIHGRPGESGHIQDLFELMNLPYLGASGEISGLCFNKISTKLWLSALNIPNTPYTFLSSKDDISLTVDFFRKHGEVVIKPSHQGSSIGVNLVTNEKNIDLAVENALALSPFALIEKFVKGRELEVSIFSYKDNIVVTAAGEISCAKGFYSYEEKYGDSGCTETKILADLPQNIQETIQRYAKKAFEGIGIKDLARIDFFLSEDHDIYLNEINTMPGHTPISMFPTMLQNHGINYRDFLEDKIYCNHRKKS